jgi:hypothetical protein
MGRRSVIAVAAVLVALVSAAAAWAATAPPSGPDPVVEEWPAWPYLTQCGGLPFYPVTVFSGNAEAELGTRPSEVALREALERGELPYVSSKSNWRLIAEDQDQAEFAHGRLAGRLEWVAFEFRDGKWQYQRSSSDCNPESILGEGRVVAWSLAEPELAPSVPVRRIRIHLNGGECSSGQPQNPRARLVFRKWGRKLLMSVWLEPLPPGFYTCQGIFEPPLKVTLPRKMRLHRLWDGGTYPPRPAIKPALRR